MGNKRKGSRKPSAKDDVYDSDDDRKYSREKVPNPHSDEYYHDEIDDFHSNRDKILLDRGASLIPKPITSDEEEVLGLDDDDDEAAEEEVAEYERKLKQLRSQGFTDDHASDLDDDLDDDKAQSDADANQRKAWGKRRAHFYGGETAKQNKELSDSELDEATLEEQEALAIQKRLIEQLDEQDTGLNFLQAPVAKTRHLEEKGEKITKDLSKLSKKEKIKLVKKESPELIDLLHDYEAKLSELKDSLLPLQTCIRQGVIPATCSGADYINTKVKLYLSYCTNLSFYLMLKAKRVPVQHHPVIGRIVQYRKLLEELVTVDNRVRPEIDALLHRLKNETAQRDVRRASDVIDDVLNDATASSHDSDISEVTVSVATPSPVKKVKRRKEKKQKMIAEKATNLTSEKRKKLSELLSDSDDERQMVEAVVVVEPSPKSARKKSKLSESAADYETTDEKTALQYYDMMKAGRRACTKTAEQTEEDVNNADNMDEFEDDQLANDGDVEDDTAPDDTRRAIDKQIAKNRGLTPHRKKEYRNPRVKHRLKYRKAKIRRRGQVREVRTEMTRYSGEVSGIRAGITRSVKIKA